MTDTALGSCRITETQYGFGPMKWKVERYEGFAGILDPEWQVVCYATTLWGARRKARRASQPRQFAV